MEDAFAMKRKRQSAVGTMESCEIDHWRSNREEAWHGWRCPPFLERWLETVHLKYRTGKKKRNQVEEDEDARCVASTAAVHSVAVEAGRPESLE